MRRLRICTWLLVVLAVPAQAIASSGLRLPCFGHEGGAPAAVEMDCHAAAESAPADCCGDSCPDMTACAAHPAASPPAVARVVKSSAVPPADPRAVPPLATRLATPFRPPASAHA